MFGINSETNLFMLVKWFRSWYQMTFSTFRDVYHIESILSYRYHKTDTVIISIWQKKDTFNDTFYDDINKDRAS